MGCPTLRNPTPSPSSSLALAGSLVRVQLSSAPAPRLLLLRVLLHLRRRRRQLRRSRCCSFRQTLMAAAVADAKVIMDFEDPELSRGFGFVSFESQADMQVLARGVTTLPVRLS